MLLCYFFLLQVTVTSTFLNITSNTSIHSSQKHIHYILVFTALIFNCIVTGNKLLPSTSVPRIQLPRIFQIETKFLVILPNTIRYLHIDCSSLKPANYIQYNCLPGEDLKSHL